MDVIELLERMKSHCDGDTGITGIILADILTKTIEDCMRDRVVEG